MVNERTLEYSVLATLGGIAVLGLLAVAGITDNSWAFAILGLGSW